jgi:hypothetical protein
MSDSIDRRSVIVAACGAAAVAGLSMFLFSHAWARAIYGFGFVWGDAGAHSRRRHRSIAVHDPLIHHHEVDPLWP